MRLVRLATACCLLRKYPILINPSIILIGNSGLGLLIPTAFYTALHESAMPEEELLSAVLKISRITAILLIISYGFYVWYNMRTHHTIYDAIFLADEHADTDRHIDIYRDKLTFTESLLALAISIALVTLFAIHLVSQIHYIVETHHVSDLFMGLILVPLVEKIAEHITAVDEAYDNTMNTAMAHVLGATIQTALFNGPLAVIVGWIIKKDLNLNFDLFTIIVVILSIIVVGNFLKDKKSNYLEGALSVIAYIIISVAAYYYPNLHLEGGEH